MEDRCRLEGPEWDGDLYALSRIAGRGKKNFTEKRGEFHGRKEKGFSRSPGWYRPKHFAPSPRFTR